MVMTSELQFLSFELFDSIYFDLFIILKCDSPPFPCFFPSFPLYSMYDGNGEYSYNA